jgi:hypothetical protein
MRTLVLGDIHGHNSWVDIVNKERFDKIVFLGNYFDSHNKSISSEDQYYNYKAIRELKLSLKDDCILLLGNHDYHYLHEGPMYSGYKPFTYNMVHDLLVDDYSNKMIVPIHMMDNIILSHAGISSVWMRDIAKLQNIEDINKLPLEYFDFNTVGGFNPYGDSITQSPIWIRPKSLLQSRVEGYKQIVGHTTLSSPMNDSDIWFNDLLPSHYIIIEDNNIMYVENK